MAGHPPVPLFERLGAPLWIKLTGIFAAVIVVGVTVTVVLARQGTATQFSHVMMGNRVVHPAVLQQALTRYYGEQGSWAGLDRRLAQIVRAASTGGRMGGMMGHMMGTFDGHITVLDSNNNVVASIGAPTGALDPLGMEQGWPLLVDGRRVGTLLLDGTLMGMAGADSAALVAGVTRAVIVAALVAGLVALLLGALLIRQITRPLAALSFASQRIAAGERDVRVPVRSGDEVGQLASTFNQMAEALEDQENLRRNLMADIAHELRTPLSGIQGTVEAMQDGVFPITPQNLESIYEQVALLNRLVEDLRTLAHAEAGQLSLSMKSLDLAELVAPLVTTLRSQAQQKGVDLRLVVEKSLPTVQGDEERLGQVLMNLLVNALRHTPAGGMVTVVLSPAEDGVQMAVLDTGEGISPADLPHLFERFYRSDRSRSRASGGSGLGLAIARQFVEAHGGHMRAESPPPGQNHGSGFYVWLPAAE